VLGLRPDHAEDGRAEHDPADQLSHDRRLAHALDQLAKQTADQKQQDDLRDKQRFRRPGPPVVRPRMRGGAKRAP
jgi:Mg-chelatase subunit ChlD